MVEWRLKPVSFDGINFAGQKPSVSLTVAVFLLEIISSVYFFLKEMKRIRFIPPKRF